MAMLPDELVRPEPTAERLSFRLTEPSALIMMIDPLLPLAEPTSIWLTASPCGSAAYSLTEPEPPLRLTVEMSAGAAAASVKPPSCRLTDGPAMPLLPSSSTTAPGWKTRAPSAERLPDTPAPVLLAACAGSSAAPTVVAVVERLTSEPTVAVPGVATRIEPPEAPARPALTTSPTAIELEPSKVTLPPV